MQPLFNLDLVRAKEDCAKQGITVHVYPSQIVHTEDTVRQNAVITSCAVEIRNVATPPLPLAKFPRPLSPLNLSLMHVIITKVALTCTVGVVGAPSAILSAVKDCQHNTEQNLNVELQDVYVAHSRARTTVSQKAHHLTL